MQFRRSAYWKWKADAQAVTEENLKIRRRMIELAKKAIQTKLDPLIPSGLHLGRTVRSNRSVRFSSTPCPLTRQPQ